MFKNYEFVKVLQRDICESASEMSELRKSLTIKSFNDIFLVY